MKNKFESMTLEQMSWQLRKSKADLSSSYDEMCTRFTIPQEVRLAYDRCHEETDGILSQIIKAMTPSNKDSSDLQSRTSSVSSKRLELTAKAAALQAEQNAKSEEARLQAELTRLEAEEAIRQAQLEADRIVNQVKQEAEEKKRQIKIKLEMDHRRQELENRSLETEMQKTNAELKEWTRFEELDEDRYFYGQQDQIHSNPLHPSEEFVDYFGTLPHSSPIQPQDKKMQDPTSQRLHQHDEDTQVQLGPAAILMNANKALQNNSADIVTDLVQSISLSRLPSPEPWVFTGDPLNYPSWKASFNTLINTKGVMGSERIHYLRKYLGGEAKSVVEGTFYLKSEEAY